MSALLKRIVHCLQYRRLRRCRSGAAAVRAGVLAGAVIIASVAALPANAQQTITTDEAIARAQQQVPGKLVAVTTEQQGDQTVYRVRILGSDGVVRTVFVNATR